MMIIHSLNTNTMNRLFSIAFGILAILALVFGLGSLVVAYGNWPAFGLAMGLGLFFTLLSIIADKDAQIEELKATQVIQPVIRIVV